MTLFTSYFDNIKFMRKVSPNICLVSIAGYCPSDFTGSVLKELQPKKDWWKEWHKKFKANLESPESIAWYKEAYTRTVLDKTSRLEVMKHLDEISNEVPVCLLCYETPDKFCHRKIVADWLRDGGYLCYEFDDGAAIAAQ